MEYIFALSDGPLVLPKRPRLSPTPLSFDNGHDGFGPVDLEPWSSPDTWTLSYGDKKRLFGEEHRIAVGGQTPGVDLQAEELPSLASEGIPLAGFQEDFLPGLSGLQVHQGRGAAKVRDDSNVEPVFFHEMPLSLLRELVHSHAVDGILDLTAGSGQMAKAAMQLRVVYTGVCLTDSHRQELAKRLQGWVFQELRNPETMNKSMFNLRLTNMLRKATKRPADGGANPVESQTPAKTRLRLRLRSQNGIFEKMLGSLSDLTEPDISAFAGSNQRFQRHCLLQGSATVTRPSLIDAARCAKLHPTFSLSILSLG